jgi:DnaK suppressor protein
VKIETKRYLEKLVALRESLAHDIHRMEDNSLRDHAKTLSIPTDNEELGSDNADQDLTLTLLESGEEVLDQVEEAIERIEDESFGECTECGKPISSERLDAIPYAAMCVRCASQEESSAGVPPSGG